MDLVSPTEERTRKILAAIINLGRFSEEHVEFIEGLQQQYVNASEERDDLENQIIELRKKLDDHKSVAYLFSPELRLSIFSQSPNKGRRAHVRTTSCRKSSLERKTTGLVRGAKCGRAGSRGL